MLNTQQVLEAVRDSTPKKSWYATARAIGVTDQLINAYRKKGYVMNDEMAIKCAKVLKIPTELMFLWQQCERVHGTPAEAYWLKIAADYEKDIVGKVCRTSPATGVGEAPDIPSNEYILCEIPTLTHSRRQLENSIFYTKKALHSGH